VSSLLGLAHILVECDISETLVCDTHKGSGHHSAADRDRGVSVSEA
jgi:hypothetical protein